MGAWAILPIISAIKDEYKDKKAVLFCDEESRVNLDKLMVKLGEAGDFSRPIFLGRGLRDKDATIIHHFAFYNNPSSFAYPDFSACFVLSLSMVTYLAEEMKTRSPVHKDFTIDPKHELALFAWDSGKGYPLTEVDFLCTVHEHDECATHYPLKSPQCGPPVDEDNVYIGVKTCSKFHGERVPVVQKTWGKDAKHLDFYSEVEDSEIPTFSTGVPNTEMGHCGKLEAMLKRMYSHADIKDKEWLVVADDDTILGVPHLRRLLACYDPSEAIVLGERYGFGLFGPSAYNYVTGGGGIVISRKALGDILEYREGSLCNSIDAPDDMTLGMVLRRLNIPVIHSPLFHQARPTDYSADFLNHQDPVSFHKHWMVDPEAVYKQWFSLSPEVNESKFPREDL